VLLDYLTYLQGMCWTSSWKLPAVAGRLFGPRHLAFDVAEYWHALLERGSEVLVPATRVMILLAAVRCAVRTGAHDLALEAVVLLFASDLYVRAKDVDGEATILDRAVALEAQVVALETIIDTAPAVAPPVYQESLQAGRGYREKLVPNERLPTVSSILHELQATGFLGSHLKLGRGNLVPAHLFEVVQQRYLELAILWEDFGLPYQAAWANVRRADFMIRESNVDFLLPPGSDEFRIALDQAAMLEGPVSYVANKVAALACRSSDDFQHEYLAQAAIRAWSEATCPALAISLTFDAMAGITRLGSDSQVRLRKLIERHALQDNPRSWLWEQLDINVRGALCEHLLPSAVQSEDDSTCRALLRVAESIAADPALDPNVRKALEELLVFARRVSQFNSDPRALTTEMLEDWEGVRHSAGHARFLCFVWTRMSARQRGEWLGRFCQLVREQRDPDWKYILLSRLLPVEDSGAVRELAPTAQAMLERMGGKMDLEGQRDLASLVHAWSGVEQWNRLSVEKSHQILEREKSTRVQAALRRGDALAIAVTYFHQLRHVRISLADRNDGLMDYLESVVPGTADFLRVETCPRMVVGMGQRRVCLEFFTLAHLLLSAKDPAGLTSHLRDEANAIAMAELPDFFDVVLEGGGLSPETVDLIRSHRGFVIGGLQRFGIRPSAIDEGLPEELAA